MGREHRAWGMEILKRKVENDLMALGQARAKFKSNRKDTSHESR